MHCIGANQRPGHRFLQVEQNEPVIAMIARQESSVGADRQGPSNLAGFRKKDLLRLRGRRVPHQCIELRFAFGSLSHPLAIVAHLEWSPRTPQKGL